MNGDNGDNGDNGENGGNGGGPYDIAPIPKEPIGLSLIEQHNKSMAEIDVQQFIAEKEMNAARTDYLKALSETEERDTNLVGMMPDPEKKAALPLGLMIGVALLLWGKIL